MKNGHFVIAYLAPTKKLKKILFWKPNASIKVKINVFTFAFATAF